MAMNAFKKYAAKLAFQVDRKILYTEDAGYIRLDIPAHEHVNVAALTFQKPLYLQTTKRFLVSAIAIYLTLFAMTNAEAYSKLIMASVNDYMAIQESSIIAYEPSKLSLDPWTGERSTENFNYAQPLETLEKSVIEPADSLPALTFTPTTLENRVQIGSVDVNAPLITPELGVEALVAGDWNTLDEQLRSSLLQGVVHYPGTAKPGEKGNFVITGHSSNVFWEISEYNTIFALLPRIEIGEEIEITYNQEVFKYKVIEKKEVLPSDVSVLQQGDRHLLTAITCTPVGTSLRRLIVVAELVQ